MEGFVYPIKWCGLYTELKDTWRGCSGRRVSLLLKYDTYNCIVYNIILASKLLVYK